MARGNAGVAAVAGERLQRALREVVDKLDEADLSAVVSQPSDVEALVVALGRAKALSSTVDPRVLEAQMRGRAAKIRMLGAEGGFVQAGQMAELLGLSRQAVDKRRAAGQLFALREREGSDWLYPVWQLQDGAPLSGFERVLRVLLDADHDSWSIVIFFLETEVGDGERTPLQALRDGDEDAAMRAAAVYGEHGAK